MNFELLLRQLIAEVRKRVRGGEVTERRLARRCGLSQPHVHNVLKGRRTLSVAVADLLLRGLQLTIDDLRGGEHRREVPLLAGMLGPGQRFPSRESRERFPWPHRMPGGDGDVVACRLAGDPRMRLFAAGDLALLDRSPECRRQLREDAYYALRWNAAGALRRCRHQQGRLYVLDDGGGAEVLTVTSPEEVIQGRVEAIVRLDPRAPPDTR